MIYQYLCNEVVSHQRIGPNDFLEQRTTYEQQQLPLDTFPVDMIDFDVGWYMFNAPFPGPVQKELVAFPDFGKYPQSLSEHEALLLQRFKLFALDIYEVCEKL
jgi:hypothetical protein